MTTKFYALYTHEEYVDKMAQLITPRVERLVQRLLGIARYEYSDGRYPGFSSEIISCHYPLRDDHVEHINRVIVGHLMLRCAQLAYFSSRLDPTLSEDKRASYDNNLQVLGKLFRGEHDLPKQPTHLKQQLVFALAILHDVGKTAFLNDAGHEERAGKLVEKILESIQGSIGLDTTDVSLGRTLIENHTMLGTLVQGERSSYEVFEWLKRNRSRIYSPEMFLSYLLLLNSVDLSGYRYMPIILDHYWIRRYMKFSTSSTVQEYASAPVKFAEYRLRELARSSVSDFGDTQSKKRFHEATKNELMRLDLETQKTIGRMWIRDALYFIVDFNRWGVGNAHRWTNDYASLYVRFFNALAKIVIQAGADTIAYRQGDNPDPRTAAPERLQRLLERLKKDKCVVDSDSFQNKEGTIEFTINNEGLLVGA